MFKFTLRKARQYAGYTQQEVHEKTGYSLSTIKNWEAGKTFPTQPAIEALSALYGIPYDCLEFSNS